MERANNLGYKVNLYFIATADPAINIARVEERVAKGGHDVPTQNIIDRYTRSLNLVYEAAQFAYQAYFFDNSGELGSHKLVAHFKMVNRQKKWDSFNGTDLSDWFIKYYVNKQQ